MAKQFKVLVNSGKDQEVQTFNAEQGAGQRGRALEIKAQAGAKYQLVEVGKGKNLAPDNIKAKRVGKNLHLMFEADEQADVVIEDYYAVAADKYNAVVGLAENGRFYVDSSTKLSQVSHQILSHLVIDISLLVCG